MQLILAMQLGDLLPWLHGYGGLLLQGVWRTIYVGLAGYAVGLIIGLSLALWASMGGSWARRGIYFYSAMLRALPELILIMLLYYICGDAVTWLFALLGFGHIEVDGPVAAVIVLGLASSAYAVEIFGAALRAVPLGMVEAGLSLGMSRLTGFRRISFPLMMPVALSGLSNLWLMVLKGTSLVSVVGVMELALAAEQGAGATKAYFTFYATAAAIYLLLAYVSQRLFRRLEQSLRRDQEAA